MCLLMLLDEDTRHGGLWDAILQHNRSSPGEFLHILRVGDSGAPPLGTKDFDLLTWSVINNRIVISQDRNTLIALHSDIVEGGVATPGILMIRSGGGDPC